MHSEFRELPGVTASFYNYRTYRKSEPVNNDRLAGPNGNERQRPGQSGHLSS